MKKITQKILLAALSAALILGGKTTAFADSYTYDIQDKPVKAPDAYEWEASIRSNDLGIDTMSSLEDVYCKNDRVFIAMGGKIIITDYDFNVIKIITEYTYEGKTRAISAPKCVFVTDNDEIYITEEAMGEIVELDLDGNCIRVIGDPHIKSIENITYAPSKVCVDSVGRIYVKAKSVYEGIIELDPEGNYVRFVGANEVAPSLAERFKRAISTKEQIAQMTLWLPTDYSDLTMDKEGYLYATVRDNTVKNPIRKLNSAGTDVLTSYEYIAPPAGDYLKSGGTSSTITSIAVSLDGRFAVLDANQARIFVYGNDGILLYVLGGSGKQNGQLNGPVDFTFMDDRILVADLVTCSIEVFRPTDYGRLINEALHYQTEYDYENAARVWSQVYEINPAHIAANMGIGKYQLRSADYEGALKSFEKTGERKNWSAAFERVRESWLEEHLGKLIIVVIAVIIALCVIKAFIRKLAAKGVFEGKRFVKVLKKIKYTAFTWPGYMMSSPFKAFDDVKYENAGSTSFAVILMVIYAWMSLINARYKGFLLNTNDINHINVPLILTSAVAPFIIFVIANWAIGVLIDGKGNFRNVFVFTSYALYPQIICSIIGVLLSRICIYEETGLVTTIYAIGWVLFGFYLFVGLTTVHQFTFRKALLDILLSAVGMAIIIFISVLLATLVSGFVNDVGTIVDEVKIYL